jgi:hypothetical protein
MGWRLLPSWRGKAIRSLELNNDESWFRLVQIFAKGLIKVVRVPRRQVTDAH